jgi:FKBP-type peptidyl-prolyl cis-trans isomerase SlyD
MMKITNNSVVSIRYIMMNSAGEIIENTMNDNPVNYLHGSAAILPLLQLPLEGLKAGDKKRVYLMAESGLTNEDFIFDVIIDEVRLAFEEELLLGYPVKINVKKCEVDCDCYSGATSV